MEKDNQRDKVEITLDEVILDSEVYDAIGKHNPFGVNDFGVGDYIVYFRGNNTWRAEIVKKVASGYIVKDY